MRPAVRIGVPVLLAVLAVAGAWLVVAGGSSDGPEPGATDGPGTTEQKPDDPERLPIDETDMDSVAELADLSLPPSTEGFTSARLDDDSQLDVTFTLDPVDEAAFLEGSGLPTPEADQRVITHASPLWQMNVEGTIRGAADSSGGVTRALELIEEGELVRVRLVLTPAG